MLSVAIAQHEAAEGPFVVRAMLKARGHELGLFGEAAPQPAGPGDAQPDDDELDDLSGMFPLPAHMKELIQGVREHEAELSFADRLQIAQFLENHNVFDVASDLLAGRVQLDRNTVGLPPICNPALERSLWRGRRQSSTQSRQRSQQSRSISEWRQHTTGTAAMPNRRAADRGHVSCVTVKAPSVPVAHRLSDPPGA